MSECPSRELLLDFLAGRSTSESGVAVARHLAQCDSCQRLADLVTDDAGLRQLQAAARGRPTPAWRREVPTEPTHEPGAEPMPQSLGRFRLLRRLGAGGFGVVYLAHDTLLDREVALKVPQAGALAHVSVSDRFFREARAAAVLHHPQIVALHDAGQYEGVCYLASAYCPGDTLAWWLHTNGRATTNEAATIVLALAEAAQHAHEHGVLHRDIKPQNVLLDPRVRYRGLAFTPKLTDFGIAKLMESTEDATASHVLLGTPRYMSPEQVSGERARIGPPCDVYALGVLLYELTTGTTPIGGVMTADTLRRVLDDEPTPPRQLVPDLARDLEAVCLKCLEKSPQLRYATARALADDLERFLTGLPTVARPIGPVERTVRWAKRHRGATASLGAVVAGLLFVIGGLLLYNARLNDFNANLGTALTDAKQARADATASEAQTQQLLYVADMRLAARAAKDGDVSGMLDRLRRHVPRDGQPDRRGLEWHYLWSLADIRPREFAMEPGNSIYFLAQSPDGKRIASCGKDAIVRVYERASRRVERSIPTGQSEVNSVAFAPDGKSITTAGDDGTVRIWSLADGRETRRIPVSKEIVFQARFTPDGRRIVTCGKESVVSVWDAATGERVGSIDTNVKHVDSIAIAPDGEWVAAACTDNFVRVYSLRDWSRRHAFRGDAENVFMSSVAFTPDGRWVVSGDLSGAVYVWDLRRNSRVATGRHLDNVYAVAAAPDGKSFASGDGAGVLCVWDLNKVRADYRPSQTEPIEMKPVQSLHSHAWQINTIHFPDAGHVLTAGADGTIRTWAVAPTGLANVTRVDWGRFRSPVLAAGSAAFIPTVDGTCYRIDLPRDPSGEQPRHLSEVGALTAVNDAGTVVVCGADLGQFHLWTASGDLAATWSLPDEAEVKSFALSPDGALLAVAIGSSPKRVLVVDSQTGAARDHLPLPDGTVRGVQFAPDGQQIACILDGFAYLWDRKSGSSFRIATEHGTLWDLAYSPDGRLLATCGSDRLIKFWNPRTGERLGTLAGHRGSVNDITFTPDGRSLLSASADGALKIWSVAAHEELFDLYQAVPTERNHRPQLVELTISPDGRTIACIESVERQLIVIHLATATR